MVLKKQDLDHQVWKLIKLHALQEKKILVALSGGVDSVALLRTLTKVHKKNLLGAAYFHHGEDSNKEYRDRAQIFCEKLCKKWGVPFFPLASAKKLKSESQYREARYQAFKDLMQTEGFVVLATGHHREDLLETRLLRLIRGTGAQGLQAMHEYKAGIFRPLLEIAKSELKDYLRAEKVRSLEDPTNKDLDPLRNWVRLRWLPQLEKKQPGSSASLARSLETIALELEGSSQGDLLQQNEDYKTHGLLRGFYLSLNPTEQKRLLAQYLFALGKRDFSQSQLEEIQKRLDKSQKVITFQVGKCNWEVNAQQIKVQS
ncbi:tRNA lysidine(34) synthetase TilS [Bdellovibrio reynosensis]|uniref:tRNA(Ile)-lysidine synthase n=1 Tax=Bdellovibrio reynosensis TaxID=2835041 RepID=A0ABY4CCB1_9BACT|nr:tRNA lysidine(34) synthetase TilS [Bdellovibrio reynosensis]UOF02084.1 tRNA lysidine(34) synthetase TilS [Bdellovibrio reynosensis]